MNLNEWLDNPDRKGIPLPVADAIRTALAEVERLRARINKALKAAPKDPDRVWLRNLRGYIRAMVKALGGEK